MDEDAMSSRSRERACCAGSDQEQAGVLYEGREGIRMEVMATSRETIEKPSFEL